MAISRDAPGPAVRRRRTCCDECQCGSRRGLDVGEGEGHTASALPERLAMRIGAIVPIPPRLRKSWCSGRGLRREIQTHLGKFLGRLVIVNYPNGIGARLQSGSPLVRSSATARGDKLEQPRTKHGGIVADFDFSRKRNHESIRLEAAGCCAASCRRVAVVEFGLRKIPSTILHTRPFG